jgi:hypothetical protein
MTDATFAERSQAAFRQRFPEIAAAIDDAGGDSELVVEAGRAIDIVVGDRRIYGRDGRQLAHDQVAAFIAKPLRLIMEQPGAAGLVSPICVDLLDSLERVLEESGVGEIRREPDEASTFLVVLGVGLGHHLVELLRATRARWLIVVEPFVEFIEYSFSATDWAELLDIVDERQGAVHFVTDLEPSQMVTSIMRCMQRYGIPYIDGTWVFTHYPLWAFAEARKRLHGAAEFAFINRGFFEDEIVMMTNTVGNLTAQPFLLINAKRRLHRPELAVIVGAGPSLDEAIDKLREIRDRVVLFSAGTALRPLLRNGIVPDFHCELENGPQVVEVLTEASKHGDLGQIALIASTTVDPRVPMLFGKRFMFFRDTVSSTRILKGECQPISGAAPTCVNTAMATAAAFGFTNFLLFGTDCGVRSGRDDHAEGTIYRDIWKAKTDLATAYPLEVEGNFGGIAMTNWIYDGCRRMLAEAIHQYHLSVVNCSDGALIPGATPKVPEAVEVAGPPVDRVRLFAALEKSTMPCQPGAVLRAVDLDAIVAKSRALYRDLAAVIDKLDPETPDFAAAFAALAAFVEEAGNRYGYTDAIPDGTLWALPRIAMFYGSRIREPTVRRTLYDTFLAKLRATCADMEHRTEELFARLVERMDQLDEQAVPALKAIPA